MPKTQKVKLPITNYVILSLMLFFTVLWFATI